MNAAGHGGPVAIVGMAALLPGAPDLEVYWRNVVTGVDAITEAPAGRLDPAYFPEQVYCRRGGFVDAFAEVEVTRFGIMPNAVADIEPDQLIALSVAAAAIADTGGEQRLPGRDRIGVVLGRGGYLSSGLARLDQRLRTAYQLTHTLGELFPELDGAHLDRVRKAFIERLGPHRAEHAIGLVPNLAASRLASRLDLRGPAYTVDAACASSLIAVDQAVAALAGGTCDMMLAGGVHHCHDITLWSVFAQLGALSPSQRSRPFHAGADGILIGEGTGMVVLKRLADAQRDGDRIYAVIRGIGVAGDGRAGGLVAPDSGGQIRAIRRAWHAAGLDPRDPEAIGLLEAHGTGTPAGDSAELATLAEVFGPPRAGRAPVIGSVKSMIGHTMPAAGAAGLIKAALAIHRATLPPTLHCDDPHPALGRTRFRPLAAAAPWDAGTRRAAVNAFGFGGINAHVVLEATTGGPARGPSVHSDPVHGIGRARVDTLRAMPGAGLESDDAGPPVAHRATVHEPERVLRLAADTPERLAALLDADDTDVRALVPTPIRPDGGSRLGIVEPTAPRLALARRVVGRGRAFPGRDDVWFSPRPLLAGGHRLAFIFSGLEAEFEPRGLTEIASRFGLDLPTPAVATAGDTARQGIGVLTVARLLDLALRRMGVVPDGVAGHSVGEWSAMVAGGLCPREQADHLLAAFDPDTFRVPGVSFATLGAPADQVATELADRPDIVVSHDNSPHQCVVCGPQESITELLRWFRSRRVLGQVLPFRSGFHTPMLAPYLAPLAGIADRLDVRPAAVAVWSGTTAAPFPDDPAGVRSLFLRHLLEPVRFRPLIEAMYSAGYRVFVQVGTGRLGSLIDDNLNGREHLTVPANTPHRGGLPQLRRVALALWTEGSPITSDALNAPQPATPAALDATAARPPARLALGGPLVSLDHQDRAELGATLRAALRPVTDTPRPGQFDALRGVADHLPATVELGALLTETLNAAAAVLTAARTASPVPNTSRAGLVVSVRTMPHLVDHCFIPQRLGWPDLSDRRPVVPATTIMRQMMDATEHTAPGLIATALREVRFNQWLDAHPEVTVEVTATPASDGGMSVTCGPYARARAELAPRYPADRPAPWPVPHPTAERACAHSPADLYDDRWLFHGPSFQGITRLTGIGDRHIRGTLTVAAAPGALLDNVGQLLGYWLAVSQPDRAVVFPVEMDEVRFYGPHPPVGVEVGCVVRVTLVTDTAVVADAQVLVDGAVWAEVRGWRDRRFACPLALRSGGYPERRALSEPRAGGWTLLADQWPDPASRELVMHIQLGREERAEYAQRPTSGRQGWLLGRIAAKDAVRHRLWRDGEDAVFPAEIRIRDASEGRLSAIGRHGRVLPALDLSLAQQRNVAVAIARSPGPAGGGVGIGIEEIAADTVSMDPRDPTPADEHEPGAVWSARLRATQEAVTAAVGGTPTRPPDLTVTAVTADELTVVTPGRHHRVRSAQIAHGARTYVVAWTPPDEEEPAE